MTVFAILLITHMFMYIYLSRATTRSVSGSTDVHGVVINRAGVSGCQCPSQAAASPDKSVAEKYCTPQDIRLSGTLSFLITGFFSVRHRVCWNGNSFCYSARVC